MSNVILRLGKFACAIFIATYAAAFGKAFTLFIWYAKNRPTTPQSEHGWVFPLNNHGVFHYITSGESELLGLLGWVSGVTGIFVFALALTYRLLKNEKHAAPVSGGADSLDQYVWLSGTIVFFLMVFLFTEFGISISETVLNMSLDFRAH